MKTERRGVKIEEGQEEEEETEEEDNEETEEEYEEEAEEEELRQKGWVQEIMTSYIPVSFTDARPCRHRCMFGTRREENVEQTLFQYNLRAQHRTSLRLTPTTRGNEKERKK